MAKLNDNFYNRIIEGDLSLSEKEAKAVTEKAKLVVSNIEQLTDAQLSALKCGDIVAKKTGNQYHAYIVSYKEDATGICLTYVDGSGYMETVSYDYTQGHWVYNSTDVTQVPSDAQIKALAKEEVENAQEGTIDKTLGLNSSGKLVKGSVNAGMSNPMTTAGDVIVGGASGTPTRLGKGTAGQVLTMNSGGTEPEWKTPSGGGASIVADVGPLDGGSMYYYSNACFLELDLTVGYNSHFSYLVLGELNGNYGWHRIVGADAGQKLTLSKVMCFVIEEIAIDPMGGDYLLDKLTITGNNNCRFYDGTIVSNQYDATSINNILHKLIFITGTISSNVSLDITVKQS